MKKFYFAPVIALLLFVTNILPAKAETGFEGTITWALTMAQLGGSKTDMTINVKGEKIETELDMGAQGAVKVYIDRAKKKIYVAMAAMKMGMVMDIPDEKKAMDM